jgi:hypothetical protein
MEITKQQTVADVLQQFANQGLILMLDGDRSLYEMAGKILDAIRFEGLPSHDCQLDEWLSGVCPHPSHHYELLEDQRPLSASEEHHLATT